MYGHETHWKLEMEMIGEIQRSNGEMPSRCQRARNRGGNIMWEQYRKTFVGMQAVIFAVTCGMYLAYRQLWVVAVMFFVTMQVSAVVGAMWATRLRRKLTGRAG
jgi:hypothetical protein